VHMVSADLGDMSDQGRDQVQIYSSRIISMISRVLRWVIEGIRTYQLYFVADQLDLQEILADI
jgi:hypothetical protein